MIKWESNNNDIRRLLCFEERFERFALPEVIVPHINEDGKFAGESRNVKELQLNVKKEDGKMLLVTLRESLFGILP